MIDVGYWPEDYNPVNYWPIYYWPGDVWTTPPAGAGDWTEVDISGESLSIVQNSSYYPHFVVEANGAGMYYDNGNDGDSYSKIFLLSGAFYGYCKRC